MPAVECVCHWHLGASSWRSSATAVATMSAIVLANVSVGVALLVYQFSGDNTYGMCRITSAIALFTTFVIAVASAGYILVSARAERSSQMHLHGLALLFMLVSNTAYMASEVFMAQHACSSSAAAIIFNYVFWGCFKVLFWLLMKQKMTALGQPISCCVQASLWGRALVASLALAASGGAGAYAVGLALLLRGHSCHEAQRIASLDVFEADAPTVGKVALVLFTFLASIGVAGVYVAGFAMMNTAYRLAHRAVLKLRERDVPPEELAKVLRTLGHHVLGLFISIISTLLVFAFSSFADGLDLFGEGTENLIGGVAVTIDRVGDVTAILLLSGIGLLLVREDPEAGDISGHFRSLLRSAVLTSRADVVFEGRVARTPSGVCVASFPGKFLAEWNALTWACEQGDLSSACVFLPTSDPLKRFGQHAPRPETPGKCWCHSLYGEEKLWGCRWFQEWESNIQRAVDLGLELVVVFFPGEAGKGIVHWDDLGSTDLWNGVGLGGSQKSEVAYIKMRGFQVTEEDLESFLLRGWGLKRQDTTSTFATTPNTTPTSPVEKPRERR